MSIVDINGVEHFIDSDVDICGIEFDTGSDVILLNDGRRIGLLKGAYLFGSDEPNVGYVLNANWIRERISRAKIIEKRLTYSYVVLSVCLSYFISNICFYFIK
jgi:hypothetical protein